MRRHTLNRLGKSTLLTMAGNAAMFLNLDDLIQEFLVGINGAVSAPSPYTHRENTLPSVRREQTPMSTSTRTPPRLARVLSHGTERAFSDMRFSSDGRIGSFPDYLLHIWNWLQELIILRAKAFSQEVRWRCLCA